MLVRGARGTSVTGRSDSAVSRQTSLSSSTACRRSAAIAAGAQPRSAMPSSPCTWRAFTGASSSGRSAPRATGMSVRPAVSRTSSVLRTTSSTGALPPTHETARRSRPGCRAARSRAHASSTPVSTSSTTGIGWVVTAATYRVGSPARAAPRHRHPDGIGSNDAPEPQPTRPPHPPRDGRPGGGRDLAGRGLHLRAQPPRLLDDRDATTLDDAAAHEPPELQHHLDALRPDALVPGRHLGGVILLGGWTGGSDSVRTTTRHLAGLASKADTAGLGLLLAA